MARVVELHDRGRFHVCRGKYPVSGGGWGTGAPKPEADKLLSMLAETAGRTLGYKPSDFGLSALDVDGEDADDVAAGALALGKRWGRPLASYPSLSGAGLHLLYPFDDRAVQAKWTFEDVGGEVRSNAGYLVLPPGAEAALSGALIALEAGGADPFPLGLLGVKDAAPRRDLFDPTPKRWTEDDVADMLRHVDRHDEYDRWIEVGQSVHAWDAGAAGLTLWKAWSEQSPDKYDAADCERRWKSFGAARGRTVGTLVHLAKKGGWRPARDRKHVPDPAKRDSETFRYLETHKPTGKPTKGKLRIKTVKLDGLDMASLYPDPDNFIYWPDRKTPYLFREDVGLWTADPTKTFAGARLQAAAATARVSVVRQDKTVELPVRIDNSTVASGLGALERIHARNNVRFDADPHLCGTAKGVFDLRRLEARPGKRTEFVSQRLGAVPAEGETPTWDAFLLFAFPDDELRSFVLACLASMLGGVRIDAILFFKGLGGSGKSTLINAMRHLCGSYWATIPDGAVARERGVYAPHPQWKCDLRFARVAEAPETKAGQKLDAGLLNDLSGNGTINADRKYGAQESWTSNLKVVLYGNEAPSVSANSGIKRRLHVLPMDNTPPREQQDVRLVDKLRAEAPAFAWKLARLYSDRLIAAEHPTAPRPFLPDKPEAVAKYTRRYMRDNDLRLAFLEDVLAVTGNYETDAVRPADGQKALEAWWKSNGHAGRCPRFGSWLGGTFNDMRRPRPESVGGRGGRRWIGVRIKPRDADLDGLE